MAEHEPCTQFPLAFSRWVDRDTILMVWRNFFSMKDCFDTIVGSVNYQIKFLYFLSQTFFQHCVCTGMEIGSSTQKWIRSESVSSEIYNLHHKTALKHNIIYTKLTVRSWEYFTLAISKVNLLQIRVENDTSVKVVMPGCKSNCVLSFICALPTLVWATFTGWFPASFEHNFIRHIVFLCLCSCV